MNPNRFYITTTYLFFSWKPQVNFKILAPSIETWCKQQKIKGQLLIGPEGFNGTWASPTAKSLNDLKAFLIHLVHLNEPQGSLKFKDSDSPFMPFKRMKVKIKKEIVTLRQPTVDPKSQQDSTHLNPSQWNDFIKSKNPLVLDIRNDYEMELGRFKSAHHWTMKEFTDFPQLIDSLQTFKDQPILMYCTGGIRCEKASLTMKNRGFKKVYQLDGGILNYLQVYPQDEFKGECFVFDHRVALDQNLEPSKKYALCPHCGQPDLFRPTSCIQCGETAFVCKKCLNAHIQDDSIKTCSKNCRHHFQKGHNSKNIHQDARREYKRLQMYSP